MLTETEGIVLRQVKASNGRRMITVFTQKYGKVSMGTSLNEGGKNKTALAIRPFTFGMYEMYKNGDTFNLVSAQVIKSFYEIGEDFDKYIAASYILELTEKLLPEGMPQPKVFMRLKDFMDAVVTRKTSHDTIVIAYMVKLLDILGAYPESKSCGACGCELTEVRFFSIADGSFVCKECVEKYHKTNVNERLIYELNFGILDILNYFLKEPFTAFSRLALDDKISKVVKVMLRDYYRYHFDIGKLKSEELLW